MYQAAFFLLFFFFGLLSASETSGSVSFSSTCFSTCGTPNPSVIEPFSSALGSITAAPTDSTGPSLQAQALFSSPRKTAVIKNDRMHAGLQK